MLSASNKYAGYRRNTLWQRNDQRSVRHKSVQSQQTDEVGETEMKSKVFHINMLNDKFKTMCEQSLHQFNNMSMELKDLLETHNVKVVECCAFKDEVRSLRTQLDLSNHRCGQMEWLVNEEQGEHKLTRQKHRKQLALNRKQSFQIEDLKVEIVGKNKEVAKLKDELDKEKRVKLEMEKGNAEVVEGLQKELSECKKKLEKEYEERLAETKMSTEVTKGLQKDLVVLKSALKEESEKLEVSEDRNNIVLKEKVELAESLGIVTKKLDVQYQKGCELNTTVDNLKSDCNDLAKKSLELQTSADKIVSENKDLQKFIDAEEQKSTVWKASVDKLTKETEGLKEKLKNESFAKTDLLNKVDKLTRGLSCKGSENRSLIKKLDVTSANYKDLQASHDKVLLDLKTLRRVCTKEKMSRKELKSKMIEMSNNKDAEFVKVKEKFEATKVYLTKIIAENAQMEKMLGGFEAQKAVRRIDNYSSFDGDVDSSMESLVIQSEEKRDNKHKRQKKNKKKKADIEIHGDKGGRTSSSESSAKKSDATLTVQEGESRIVYPQSAKSKDSEKSGSKDRLKKLILQQPLHPELKKSPQQPDNNIWMEMLKHVVVFMLCVLWTGICVVVTEDY